LIDFTDYPTSADIVSSKADIKQIYATGHGSVKMRATYQKEKGNIVENGVKCHNPHPITLMNTYILHAMI
jgi:DNA gyrase/topoisomerase IV subunit A